jgi:hypothetical protein
MLDPVDLFRTLHRDIPIEHQGKILVAGSLAAAYAFRGNLSGHAVTTKDADLLVHSAGNTLSVQKIAEALIKLGWRPTDRCLPLQESPENKNELWAVRLMPPDSNQYFIEFLSIPSVNQEDEKQWIPVRLTGPHAGWYGIPSFKFMDLLNWFRQRSAEGLDYAAPEMIAIVNLISWPTLTDRRIKSGEFCGLFRCAKDLGRVLALAFLAGRLRTRLWAQRWREALEMSFPQSWSDHARHAGSGLRQLLADDTCLEHAHVMTAKGLLSGMGVSIPDLREIGQQLLDDAIKPLEKLTLVRPSHNPLLLPPALLRFTS